MGGKQPLGEVWPRCRINGGNHDFLLRGSLREPRHRKTEESLFSCTFPLNLQKAALNGDTQIDVQEQWRHERRFLGKFLAGIPVRVSISVKS